MHSPSVIQGLAPGIYFNLPDNIYHNDPALSRSDLLNLNDTPRTYYDNSYLNPNRKPYKPSSKFMDYGKAFHCMLLEPKEFDKRYQVIPIDAWDDTKTKITQENYYQIIESIKVLRATKKVSMFLQGATSEVTIVFDDDGMRFRTRHDIFGPLCTVDPKTAARLDQWVMKREFEQYGYDIQLALYKRSRMRFKEQFKAGEAHVYGDVDPVLFERFMAQEYYEFMFLFQRSTPPHPFRAIFPEDDTEDNGLRRIEIGKQVYRKNMEDYGATPWPVCEDKITPFSMFYGFRDNN